MPPKLPKSLQTLLDKLRIAIRDLMDRFEEGEVNAVGWRDTMKSLLTRFITASFMSGQQSPLIGVTEQGYIYEYIKAQLGFIDNFYLSIVSAAEFQEGWRQRAESYANSLVAPFWKGETKYLALPAMPGDMTTPCGQLCACLWDIKPIDEAAGDYDCYWLLNAAREITTEHCQVCEARAKLWDPLKIRNWEMVIPNSASSKELVEFIQEALKGGEGSGYFGHAGRPGEVGGSVPESNNYPKITSNIGIEEKLWYKAIENIPDNILRQANIREFSIGSVDGEFGASGYENGRIILDGSDPKTLTHEIAHAIDLSDFGDNSIIRQARIVLRDSDLITGARERITNLLTGIWVGRASNESLYLSKNNPELYSQILRLVTK